MVIQQNTVRRPASTCPRGSKLEKAIWKLIILAATIGGGFAAIGAETGTREMMPCGPNALYIFLLLSGVDESGLKETVERLPVSEDGTSMLDLKKAASALNVETSILKFQMEDIASIPLPVIAQLRSSPTTVIRTHYSVFYARDKERVYALDGTTGNKYTIRYSKLANFWTGYVLAKKPASTSGWLITMKSILLGLTVAVIGAIAVRKMRSKRGVWLSKHAMIALIASMLAAHSGAQVEEDREITRWWRNIANGEVNTLYSYLHMLGQDPSYTTLHRNMERILVTKGEKNILTIKRAAEMEGVSLECRQLNIAELRTFAKPVILHIDGKTPEAGAYLIVFSVQSEQVYFINGTTASIRSLSIEEFMRLWSGVALLPVRSAAGAMTYCGLAMIIGFVATVLLRRWHCRTDIGTSAPSPDKNYTLLGSDHILRPIISFAIVSGPAISGLTLTRRSLITSRYWRKLRPLLAGVLTLTTLTAIPGEEFSYSRGEIGGRALAKLHVEHEQLLSTAKAMQNIAIEIVSWKLKAGIPDEASPVYRFFVKGRKFHLRKISNKDENVTSHDFVYDGEIVSHGWLKNTRGEQLPGMLARYRVDDSTNPVAMLPMADEIPLSAMHIRVPMRVTEIPSFPGAEPYLLYHLKQADSLEVRDTDDKLEVILRVPDPYLQSVRLMDLEDRKKELLESPRGKKNKAWVNQIMDRLRKRREEPPFRQVKYMIAKEEQRNVICREDFSLAGKPLLKIETPEWEYEKTLGIQWPRYSIVTFFGTDAINGMNQNATLEQIRFESRPMEVPSDITAFLTEYRLKGLNISDRTRIRDSAGNPKKVVYTIGANGAELRASALEVLAQNKRRKWTTIICLMAGSIPLFYFLFCKACRRTGQPKIDK